MKTVATVRRWLTLIIIAYKQAVSVSTLPGAAFFPTTGQQRFFRNEQLPLFREQTIRR
ncbi:MAG: hypothetical protein ACPLRR_07445 [Candidatus Saccharicenans sp.]